MNSLLASIIAIIGATIYTGEGPPLTNASLVIEGDKITAIGSNLPIPASAELIQADGFVVTPGLIDAHSRLGLVEISQVSTSVEGTAGSKGDPVRAALRVSDTFNPAGQPIEDARQGGLTSVVAIPRDGLIAGQSAWVELGSNARVVESPVALHVNLAASGSDRGSRSRNFLTLRRALEDAALYRGEPGAFERRKLRDLTPSAADLKVLARALDGSLPVVFSVDRAADIRTTLSIAKEYGLWAVLVGGAEGWVVASEIAAAKVSVLINPFDNLPASYDSLEARADNAALLAKAGVQVAFTLRGDAHRPARIRQAAGIAVANGFDKNEAIAAITRVPAEIFGNADVGVLRRGSRANLVIWTGDPLELSSWTRRVFVGGRQVDLRTRKDLLTERYASPAESIPPKRSLDASATTSR
jgi:imidazolonepropionase-like amidohydrolase